jgi:hypothetical protein
LRLAVAPFALGFLAMLWQSEAQAQYRIIAEPSIEVTQVQDDNLFFSAEQPARDVILRVRPALQLQFESPRLSAGGMYGFDSERFANHSSMTSSRARQRGSAGLQFRFDPRLTFSLTGDYTDTDTPGDLNLLTGLGVVRVRVQQLTFSPLAHYRISPRLSAHASFSGTDQKSAGGPTMNSKFATVGIEQRVTPRDSFSADYEQGKYLFDQAAVRNAATTSVLRGGWTHELSPTTAMTLQAGPRLTGHSVAPELAASFTHDWQFSSVAVSALRTVTTAIGSVGTVESRSLQARFTYTPTRPLAIYAVPAVARNSQGNSQATVSWISLGARYAMTRSAGFDVAYSFNSQHGSLNTLQTNGAISRSVLSVGVTARWTAPDWLGTGRR